MLQSIRFQTSASSFTNLDATRLSVELCHSARIRVLLNLPFCKGLQTDAIVSRHPSLQNPSYLPGQPADIMQVSTRQLQHGVDLVPPVHYEHLLHTLERIHIPNKVFRLVRGWRHTVKHQQLHKEEASLDIDEAASRNGRASTRRILGVSRCATKQGGIVQVQSTELCQQSARQSNLTIDYCRSPIKNPPNQYHN